MSHKNERANNVKVLKEIHSQVLQDVARRVDKAFKNFYRRVKEGDTPGYPRYKGKGQYGSITYPQSGYKVEGGKLKLSCIGGIKIKLHRPFEGKVKICTITRKNGRYYSCFACEIECVPMPETGKTAGIDMGITDFCITSDGQFYTSPKTYRKAERALKKAQRKVSRRKKGSNRCKKAIMKLSRLHEKVANQRKDIAHKVAHDLIQKYDLTSYEDLKVKDMIRNEHLAKSIADSGWGLFFGILTYKAESAGKTVIKVDPKNTSQICCNCGNTVPKRLNERWHNCPYCGYSDHRDVNAAKNILQRATA